MKFKGPLIVVENIFISKKFYEDILGQKIVTDSGESVTFSGHFSLQSKSSWAHFTGRRASEIIYCSNAFELYFEEDNLDDFVARLKSKPEIEILHDVKEFPWGQRMIRFYDPDHHIIEVGESMEGVIRRLLDAGLSVGQVAERTMYPVELVQCCA